MNNNQNAVIALLAEYQKAIIELQHVIHDISQEDLTFTVDHATTNPDCKSIQTILSHVVSSGYSYCVYIQNFKNKNTVRPEKVNRSSIADYINDLNKILKFTQETFATIDDDALEDWDASKKILTSWGQLYDIEQLMEHAIVHILRHRRQIETFKTTIKQLH
ncbi:MAG: DinB family protein [Flavobacterium sp.]|uniref:DinB family protein n=1 Tax=Flavobacterium sp. TaxID=239 RepID=UPI002735E015|nr:DinB family protein [Flavobacterium sp.]MDP3681631.1 DinB family protein [Flavobacterium sp.]MDZ4331939.1 DinB family protein [Flavobacterium sp.]